MPFIDEQSPELNVNDEQIALINARLIELYNAKPVNFLSIIEDLLILFKNINPTHELTDAQEFYALLTITAESKALENEVIRKCNLIKFMHSAMNGINIQKIEFNRLCQIIHAHQDIPIALFLDKIFSAQLHESIVNNLMELVSGYLYVKDALPQSVINIFILKDPKKSSKPQAPHIKTLQATNDNANILEDEPIYDLNNVKPTYQPNKSKTSRKLNFDNIDDGNSMEMVELKETSSQSTRSELSFEKNYPPKIHKACIQILFFKHITSYPGVMRLQNNKVHKNAQRAIEGICTKISHYVYPHVKSAYENDVRFKFSKFIKNESLFWNEINHIRAQCQEFEHENHATQRKMNTSKRDQAVQQARHAEYTEIPDHTQRNPSTINEPLKPNKFA